MRLPNSKKPGQLLTETLNHIKNPKKDTHKLMLVCTPENPKLTNNPPQNPQAMEDPDHTRTRKRPRDSDTETSPEEPPTGNQTETNDANTSGPTTDTEAIVELQPVPRNAPVWEDDGWGPVQTDDFDLVERYNRDIDRNQALARKNAPLLEAIRAQQGRLKPG
jgi:hypothetical protein